MTMLLIGGKNDGRRVFVPEPLPIFRVPLPLDRLSSERTIQTEDYRLERLATQNQFFDYYVLESLPTEVAIRKLFDNYNPK